MCRLGYAFKVAGIWICLSCTLGLKTTCSKLLFLQVVDYVDKVAKGSKCSLHKAAQTIFTAKISGTFNRSIPFYFIFKILFYHLNSASPDVRIFHY